MISALPPKVSSVLKTVFSFPEQPLIGQVATVCNGEPRLRCMRLYDIDAQGRLLFLTHTYSQKWRQVERSLIQVCLFSEDQLVQLLALSSVERITASQSALPRKYWDLLQEDIREVYLLAEDRSRSERVPSTFGILRLTPKSWEYLKLEPDDYPASNRIRFTKQRSGWDEKRLQIAKSDAS